MRFNEFLDGRNVLLLLVTFFSFYNVFGQSIDPIAFFPLNGDAQDYSGHLNHGTMNGTTPTTDRFGRSGGAMNFNDYSQNYIDWGDKFDMRNGDFSYSIWFNCTGGTNPTIIAKHRLSSDDQTYNSYMLTNGTLYSTIYDPSISKPSIVTTTDMSDNLWHHLCVTIDRDGMMSMYIDNALYQQVDISSHKDVDYDSPFPFRLGAFASNDAGYTPTRFFRGAMDDLYLFDRVLSTQEVGQLYSNSFQFTNPIAFFPLDGDAHDHSGHLNHGTMNGTTPTTDRFGRSGGAMNFNDYSQNYIDWGDKFDMRYGDFSYSIWFNGTGGTNPVIISKHRMSSDDQTYYSYMLTNGTLRSAMYDPPTGNPYAAKLTDMSDSQWHHLCVTMDRDGMLTMYIDNVLHQQVDISAHENIDYDSPFPFRLGAFANNDAGYTPTRFFRGAMDDLYLFNRVLSPQEVGQLYTNSFPSQDVCSVINTNDDNNPGSLRYAINYANSALHEVDVNFAISGAGPYVINVSSQLPNINNTNGHKVDIDGKSQSLSGVGTGSQEIIIDGQDAGITYGLPVYQEGAEINNIDVTGFDNGIYSSAADVVIDNCAAYGNTTYGVRNDGIDVTIKNSFVGIKRDDTPEGNSTGIFGSNMSIEDCVVSDNTSRGIRGGNLIIKGCKFGTNIAGTTSLGSQQTGVYLGSEVTIGGPNEEDRNYFGGHSYGIYTGINTVNNTVQGNYFGVGPNSEVLSGLTNGMFLYYSPDTVNIKSNVVANCSRGIWTFSGVKNLSIEDNLIGLAPNGMDPMPSTTGISLQTPDATIKNNTVVSSSVGINLSSTAQDSEIKGNRFGTDITGSTPVVVSGASKAIQLSGTSGSALSNVTIGGENTEDRNIISSFSSGIYMTNTDSVTIEGNYIGTDITGSVAFGNNIGVNLVSNNSNTTIKNNLISGNDAAGIDLNDLLDTINIQGNLIGLKSNGTEVLGNGSSGISTDGTGKVTIGGESVEARNIISGNVKAVYLEMDTDVDYQVIGNYIGTDVSGTIPLENTNRSIVVRGGGTKLIKGNLIGGIDTEGIRVEHTTTPTLVQGNTIGLSSDGTTVLDTALAGIGITLYNDFETTVGGPNPGDGNVIGGLKQGVYVLNTSTDSKIQGNYFGVAANGQTAAPFLEKAVYVNSTATGVDIVGLEVSENYVCGYPSNGYGIELNSDEGGVTVSDNVIGITPSGDFAGGSYGIYCTAPGCTLSGNLVGGNAIGVYVNSTTSTGTVTDNEIINNSSEGLKVEGSTGTVENNQISGNGSVSKITFD